MTQEQSPSSAAIEPAPNEPFRFGLKQLFLLIAAIATFCGGIQAGGPAGFFFALAVVSFAVLMWSIVKRKRSPRIPAIAVTTVSFTISFLLPAVESARDAAHCSSCAFRLKFLGLALLNYHDVNKSLPPVYTVDANGLPLHSWRMYLLPFAGSTGFGPFQGFVLTEPWNSPANRRQSNSFPWLADDHYRCNNTNGSPNTDYVAVVGPDTVWQPGRGVNFSEITDDPHDTILLIEMKNSGIAWNQPGDLDATKLPAADKLPEYLKSLSNHRSGLNVLFCDGHVETIPFTIPLDQFKALLTKSGGEKIERERW